MGDGRSSFGTLCAALIHSHRRLTFAVCFNIIEFLRVTLTSARVSPCYPTREKKRMATAAKEYPKYHSTKPLIPPRVHEHVTPQNDPH